MIKKWILLLAAFLSGTQMAYAQPKNAHKTVSKHKQTTHKRTTHSVSHHKHKPIHHPVYSSYVHHRHEQATKPITDPEFDASNYTPNPVNDSAEIDTSHQTLIALAYSTIETQRYSTYKLGSNIFNPSQGIYKIDCSAYIDDLLSQANPQALSSLANWTQTYRPTSHDYYNFITRLPDEPTQYWRKVNDIEQLHPGGILVFLSEYLHRHHLYTGGGHVMLVMSRPIPNNDSSDTYQLKVADSAASGHSYDTRQPHKSGIGIGTLLLKVDPSTGKPQAYAWRLDGHWRSHTLFAMAEPTNNF